MFTDTTTPLPATSSSSPTYVVENSMMRTLDTNEKLLSVLGAFTGLSPKSTQKLKIVNKDMPMSVEVQAIFSDPFVYLKKTYFTITYLLFYPYNGTLEPHLFDQEYATVLFQCKSYNFTESTLEITTPTISRIYLSSHGKGKWFNKDEFTYSGIRPNIYVAVESHSMYPEPMVLRRFFGIANDETMENGIVYDAINNVIVLANPNSVLNNVYYELNKLYYYNGMYEDQTSILFNERRTNFLMYDGYYKVASTSELWEIKQFQKFKGIFQWIIIICSLLVFIIIIDNVDVCVLLSYLCIVVLTAIATFITQWLYFS